MSADTLIVLGISIAVVAGFAWLGRKIDQRRHQEQLELIQERIRRRQENPDEIQNVIRGGDTTISTTLDDSVGTDIGGGMDS